MREIKNNKTAESLADFIEANKDCKFEIDNDGWYIRKAKDPNKSYADDDIGGDRYEENQIADDSDYEWDTRWYGGSNCYGAGLAEALVILLNRRGFNIEASAV